MDEIYPLVEKTNTSIDTEINNQNTSCGYIIRNFVDIYGVKFIIFLIIIQFLGRGIYCALIYCIMLPLFKYFQINGLKYQILSTVALLSWAFKPLTGYISDNFIIFNYRKKYVMVIANICGIIGSIISIVILVDDYAELNFTLHSINFIVIGVFLMHFQISTNDLMLESKYTEIMREHPHTNVLIQSFANALHQFGYIIAIIIVGILSDDNNFIPIMAITLPLSVLPLIFILLNWLPEKRFEERISIILPPQKSLIILPLITFVGVIVLTICIIFVDELVSIIITSVFVIGLLIGGYFTFNRQIGKLIIYRFLSCISWINISGAIDYFFVADDICNPNGPQFSYKYFVTYTGTVGSLLALITAIIYPFLFGKWKYRNVIIFATLTYPLAGFFDMVIIQRWNVDYLKIPDKIFFLLGKSIIFNFIDMINTIPLQAMISKHCLKNYESTVYGYMSGIYVITYALSSLIGSYVISLAKITTISENGQTCNFDNLWLLILILHIIVPIIILIPVSFILIENTQPEQIQSPIVPEKTNNTPKMFQLFDNNEILS